MKIKISKSYSETGQELFPVTHIYYEIIPPSISDPQFNVLSTIEMGEDNAYLISPQVDRFSKAWKKLAKR